MKKNILLAFGALVLISLLFTPLLNHFSQAALEEIDLSRLSSVGIDENCEDCTNVLSLAKAETYSGLPVGDVDYYETEGAWGTVLFIPQNHRYPGSQVADSVNDSAEITQNQIVDIIAYLGNEHGVSFVMAEGELYGEVTDQHLARLDEKNDNREEFALQLDDLKTALAEEDMDEETCDEFLGEADEYIEYVDRDIVLAGAPYKLKVGGEDLTIYGSEVKETRDECADIVRDYMYQQDQLKTASGGAGSIAAAMQGASSGAGAGNTSAMMEKIKEMKEKMQSGGNGGQSMWEAIKNSQSEVAGGVPGASSIQEKLELLKKSFGVEEETMASLYFSPTFSTPSFNRDELLARMKDYQARAGGDNTNVASERYSAFLSAQDGQTNGAMQERLNALKEMQSGENMGNSFWDKIKEMKKKFEEKLKEYTAKRNSPNMNRNTAVNSGTGVQSLASQVKGSDSSLDEGFNKLIEEAQSNGKSDLVGKLREARGTYQELKTQQKGEETMTGLPSRTANPYSGVTDTQQLQSMLKKSEEKIQDVVIDRRNTETAENFAKALKDQDINVGILQYGAGHTDGLVKELQEVGLDVVVIQPAEVTEREKMMGIGT